MLTILSIAVLPLLSPTVPAFVAMHGIAPAPLPLMTAMAGLYGAGGY